MVSIQVPKLLRFSKMRFLQRYLSQKKIRRLRNIVAESIINPYRCYEYDPFLCRFIPPIIEITKNGYVCTICKKHFKNVYQAHQHVLQEHTDILNQIVFTYIYNKWKYIGIIKDENGDDK